MPSLLSFSLHEIRKWLNLPNLPDINNLQGTLKAVRAYSFLVLSVLWGAWYHCSWGTHYYYSGMYHSQLRAEYNLWCWEDEGEVHSFHSQCVQYQWTPVRGSVMWVTVDSSVHVSACSANDSGSQVTSHVVMAGMLNITHITEIATLTLSPAPHLLDKFSAHTACLLPWILSRRPGNPWQHCMLVCGTTWACSGGGVKKQTRRDIQQFLYSVFPIITSVPNIFSIAAYSQCRISFCTRFQ